LIFCFSYLVSTLKRRPSPSTSSLSSNSSCDRRGAPIQLTKFGMFYSSSIFSPLTKTNFFQFFIVYLGSFSGKKIFMLLFIICFRLFLGFAFSYSSSFLFLLPGTQSPDAVNKLLRLSDSNQTKTRTPNRPFHLSMSSSQTNTSIPHSASPSLSNLSTTTGLSSVAESTHHHHHHHRNHHTTKMRDTNKLTSESSSLNFKQPASHGHLIRSHTRKLNKNRKYLLILFIQN
jgi:hypothetical protein